MNEETKCGICRGTLLDSKHVTSAGTVPQCWRDEAISDLRVILGARDGESTIVAAKRRIDFLRATEQDLAELTGWAEIRVRELEASLSGTANALARAIDRAEKAENELASRRTIYLLAYESRFEIFANVVRASSEEEALAMAAPYPYETKAKLLSPDGPPMVLWSHQHSTDPDSR